MSHNLTDARSLGEIPQTGVSTQNGLVSPQLAQYVTNIPWNHAKSAAEKAIKLIPEGISSLYGIPRGGSVAVLLLAQALEVEHRWYRLSETPTPGTLIVDDICDSGATLWPYREAGYQTLSLFSKHPDLEGFPHGISLPKDTWVKFPWDEASTTPEDAVRRLLQFLGEDPNDPELKETPRRFISLLQELTAARNTEISGTTFAHEGEDLVVVRDIPLNSLCAHHMMAFSGVAHIGYIPHGRILGLSKFARVVASIAAGLTTQEEITHKVAMRISEMAKSSDVAVVTEATHSCMILRGAKAFGSSTVSSAMLGAFRAEPALRAEVMSFLR